MKQAILALASLAAMHAASTAWAHSDAHKSDAQGAQQPAASAATQNPAGGARDARAYFTDLELLTQEGRKVRFYSDVLDGRIVVINVMYASCTDACPLITQQLNDVRKRIPDLFGKRVFFVSLSSDPVHDTPKALKQFAQKQNADVEGWTFLTGRKEHIDTILKRLGQYSETVEGHSTLLIAGNVPAKRWSKIRPDAPAGAIAERLSQLAGPSGTSGEKP